MKKTLLSSLLIFFYLFCQSQIFVDSYAASTPFNSGINTYFGSYGAFGDYNNDGKLDFILLGNSFSNPTRLYKNNGAGGFSTLWPNFPNYSNSNPAIVKWLDFNNDGNLDLLFYGASSGTKLYKNSGSPYYIFTLAITIPHYNYHGIGVADLNRNGLQDIIMLGNNANMLFENNYIDSASFILDSASRNTTSYNSCSIWNHYIMDANHDGYNDIFVKYHNNNSVSIMEGQAGKPRLEEKFNGYFPNAPNIPPIDFNGNGLYDFFSSSYTANISNGNTSSFYFNEIRNDSIYSTYSNLMYGYSYNPYSAFDYDNDGNVDIIIGYNGNTYFYKNNGSAVFSLDTVYYSFLIGSCIIGDFDDDKDIDIYSNTKIYKNVSATPNTPPNPPLTTWATIDSNKVVFHWQRATDVETPQPSLSYNLMVGTSPKGIDITSPMADTVTGFRRVVELGNAQLNDFYILDKSIFNIGDTVYWSVQTIDNGFGYSPFSQQCTTIICNSLKPQFDTICNNDSLLWQGNYYN